MSTVTDPHAEPTERATASWVARLALTGIGFWAAFFGPLQVLLGLQAAEFSPGHKEATLGLVTGAGAAVNTIVTPIFGALSDRTSFRMGRRLPWVIGGAVSGAASLLLLAYAPNIAVMVLGWCLVQCCLHGSLAALTAAIPDLVPSGQRGTVSGFWGATQTLGIVTGTAVAALAGGIQAAYWVLAALVLVCVVPYVLRSNDIHLPKSHREPFTLRSFLAGFWINPQEFPDFGWAWLTRFLINTANALGVGYLLYFLTDAVGRENPAGDLFILTALYASCLVVTTILAGIWSDRLGRRRMFVSISGAIQSVAAITLASTPTWTGALIGAVLLGSAFGVYTSVDFALITQVLPKAANRAKDLGVINIAGSLPQVLAPLVAAGIITSFADKVTGYRVLFLTAATVGLIGSALVYRIRGVP